MKDFIELCGILFVSALAIIGSILVSAFVVLLSVSPILIVVVGIMYAWKAIFS